MPRHIEFRSLASDLAPPRRRRSSSALVRIGDAVTHKPLATLAALALALGVVALVLRAPTASAASPR